MIKVSVSPRTFFVFLVLIGLVGSIVYLYQFGNFGKQRIYFPCPVPEEYCDEAESLEGGSVLGFRLPEGTEFKAVTTGDATQILGNFGDGVIELRDPSGVVFFYIFQSDSYLTFSGPVEIGFVLGRAGDLLKSYPDFTFVILAMDQDGTSYPDLKELFKL